MTDEKRLLLLIFATLIQLAKCGNYLKCPENYCENAGQCILMSVSPTPPNLQQQLQLQVEEDSGYIVSTENFGWKEANDFCQSKDANLVSADDNEAKEVFLSAKSAANGFWTSSVTAAAGKCRAVLKSGAPVNSDCMSSSYVALCQTNKSLFDSSSSRADQTQDYLYTCQCPRYYGLENCTSLANTKGGGIYCQNSTNNIVNLRSVTSDKVLYIDHAVFGRPIYLPGSLSSVGDGLCRNFYAESEDAYCVAFNTLAALTYWCQGKKTCRFELDLLTDAQLFRDFFTAAADSERSFAASEKACESRGGHLASPVTEEHFRALQKKLMSREDNSSKTYWYWVDPSVAKVTSVSIIWHGGDGGNERGEGTCLALSDHFGNPYDGNGGHNGSRFFINLSWVICERPRKPEVRGAACEASFGSSHSPSSGSSSSGTKSDPSDQSCLNSIEIKVFENRYHEDVLDGKAISCSMPVDYRRGNTCYKKTVPMHWREARRQCWSWGGELAFPLDPDSDECKLPIYTINNSDELWMANSTGCFNDSRCTVAFSSDTFVEGTYATANDLCIPNTSTDSSCGSNGGVCGTKRQGLCALAPALTPRTHLTPPPLPPPDGSCSPVAPFSPGWPFEWYGWNESGIPGQSSTQACPEGQKGDASWYCGLDGEWVGYPNMGGCTKVVVEDAFAELEKPNSVPSAVVKDLYNGVSQEEVMASGDIGNLLSVVERALEVQNERLPTQTDPGSYAIDFTEETINLLNDMLRRPVTWIGIESVEKKDKLTGIQNNVDAIADSLVQYSEGGSHEFAPADTKQVLKLRVVRNVDLSQGQSFTDQQSSIKVNSNYPSNKSISFQSFSSLGCILAEQTVCGEELEDKVHMDVVNAVVLGATLYEGTKRIVTPEKNVTVLLDFHYHYDGENHNLSDVTCGYWDPNTDFWSEDGCQLVKNDNFSSQCQCDHLTNFAVILDVNGNLEGMVLLNSVLTWITIVGCTLSIISLVVCLYVFTFVRGLRGERTTIHRNLCLSLLLAEILLLSGLDATENSGLCATIAGLLHFLFLAVFAWMLVEGVHVYYMLVKVFDSARSPMWMYYLAGYAAPAVVVIISVIIVETTGTHGYGTDSYCWLDYENGLIWAFAGPALLIICVNTFMFVKALTIARRTMKKRQSTEDNKNTLTLLKGSFSLLCILGLTWVFGFTYFADGSEWLAIIFAILNSLQGVFILVFHVLMNDKAKQELMKSLRKTFRKTKAFVTREPYESSGKESSDASRSQAKYYKGGGSSSNTGVTLSSVVKSEASTQDKDSSPPGTYSRGGAVPVNDVDSKSKTTSPVNNNKGESNGKVLKTIDEPADGDDIYARLENDLQDKDKEKREDVRKDRKEK